MNHNWHSSMVRITGFEPARVAPLVPETSASANSAISALAMMIIPKCPRNV